MFVECPSGLRGSVRGLKLKEFADLSDPKLLRTGQLFTKLVSTCWLSTDSPGPYSFGGNTLPWDNMLQGDLYRAFMAIRCATFGDEYGFERTCKQSLCAHRFEFVVDLNNLPIKKLPESSILHVRNNTPFTIKVSDRDVQFKLLQSSDTQAIQRLTNDLSISMAVAQIMVRLTDVSGIERSDREAVQEWLENLDMNDGIELREAMEEADCGIDTGVVIVCPKCGDTETVDLPLGPTFFRKRKKTS